MLFLSSQVLFHAFHAFHTFHTFHVPRIRNIPNRYTQRELISELEDLGFAGTFDFLYSPLDKGTMSNVGYAFVNFKSHEYASKCIEAFHNYRFKRGWDTFLSGAIDFRGFSFKFLKMCGNSPTSKL